MLAKKKFTLYQMMLQQMSLPKGRGWRQISVEISWAKWSIAACKLEAVHLVIPAEHAGNNSAKMYSNKKTFSRGSGRLGLFDMVSDELHNGHFVVDP